MKIDAHQHFWALKRGDYGWLTADLKPLYQDFAPSDLQPLLTENGIEGTILVQAAPTVAETRYMLSLAKDHSFIKGVVGWVDFEADDALDTLAELTTDPKLVGIRPMIQDIENDDWMLNEQFTPVYQQLIKDDVIFDALTLPQHLTNLKQLIDQHPDLKVVIDHASKPEIADGNIKSWATQMADIAASSNACVKLSGMVTEAGTNWTIEKLKPYVDHLLEHFGPARMIWGSDWPVCTLASSYTHWCDTTDALLNDLDESEKSAVTGGNAIRVYNLKTDTATTKSAPAT